MGVVIDDVGVAEGGAVAAEASTGVDPLRLPTGDSSSLRVRLRCRSDLLGTRRGNFVGVERPVLLVLTRSWGLVVEEVSAEVMSVNEDVR